MPGVLKLTVALKMEKFTLMGKKGMTNCAWAISEMNDMHLKDLKDYIYLKETIIYI